MGMRGVTMRIVTAVFFLAIIVRERHPFAQPAVLLDQHPPPPSLWHRDTLTGDWGGLRTALSDQGVVFSATYIGEVLANVKGGIKRGATYDGLFLPQIDVDLEKLSGWRGANFRASMIQAHGPSLATGYVGNLIGVSTISIVPPATRLYNLWLQQNLLGDALSIRAGLMTIDAEFMTSATAAVFMNPGWLGLGLPGGGPAYPLSTPGIRVRGKLGTGVYVQAAMLSGDPTGHNGSNSPATGIPSGTVISFNGGQFFIAEAGYTSDEMNSPIAYKVGGWYHTSKRFGDQRFSNNGLSLANPASTGVPYDHRGNWGLYGAMEGSLYQIGGNGGRGLFGFARVGGSPDDRNLISFYVEGGVAFKGLIPSRAADILGASIDYARIGDRARGLDRDTRLFSGSSRYPVRGEEIVLELTYQMQIAPWMTLQPDMQYVFNPGGRVLNDDGSVRPNALILGLRSTITF
jgi:porin